MTDNDPPPSIDAPHSTSSLRLPDRSLPAVPTPDPPRLDILFQMRKTISTAEVRHIELSTDGSTILAVTRVSGNPMIQILTFNGLVPGAHWTARHGIISPDGKHALVLRDPIQRYNGDGGRVRSGAWHEQVNSASVGVCQTNWVGARKAVFEPLDARRGPLAYSKDGNLFVAGTDLDRICVWNFRLKGRCCTVLNHVEEVTHAAFMPDGESVVTASRDSTVRVSCSRTGLPVAKLEIETYHPPRLLRVSPDGKLVVSIWGPQVHLWRPDSGDLGWYNLNVTRKSSEGWPLAISPDCRFLASRIEDGLDITDIQTGMVVGLMSHMGSPITAAAFSLGGEVLLVGKLNGAIEVWHLKAIYDT